MTTDHQTRREQELALQPELWFDSDPVKGVGIGFTSLRAATEYGNRRNPSRFRVPAESTAYVSLETARAAIATAIASRLPVEDQGGVPAVDHVECENCGAYFACGRCGDQIPEIIYAAAPPDPAGKGETT